MSGGRTDGRQRSGSRVRWILAAAAALGGMAALPGGASAQDAMTASVEVVGGAFHYDIGPDRGTSPFGALRVSLPMATWLLVEPGLGYTSYTASSGHDVPFLTTEAQVQARFHLGSAYPFVGIGAGGMFDLRKDRGGADLLLATETVSAGARAWLGRGWLARAEVRLRRVGSDDSAVEWTLGMGRAF